MSQLGRLEGGRKYIGRAIETLSKSLFLYPSYLARMDQDPSSDIIQWVVSSFFLLLSFFGELFSYSLSFPVPRCFAMNYSGYGLHATSECRLFRCIRSFF